MGLWYYALVRIIALSTLKAFLNRNPAYADAREPLMAWYRQVKAADWATPADGGLKLALHQRSNTIDELHGKTDRLREQNKRLDAEAERLAEMVRLSPGGPFQNL